MDRPNIPNTHEIALNRINIIKNTLLFPVGTDFFVTRQNHPCCNNKTKALRLNNRYSEQIKIFE